MKLSQFNPTNEICPSCDSAETTTPGNVNSTPLFECLKCELIFLSAYIRPNANNDNYWYENMQSFTRQKLIRIAEKMSPTYFNQLKEISKYTNSKSIVDIGCGIGLFLYTAKKYGWFTCGCEMSPHGIQIAQNAYGIQTKTLSDLQPLQQNVIRLSHVLEHIPEPLAFLRQIHGVLETNGLLLIIVPQWESLFENIVNRYRKLFSKNPKLLSACYPDMHVLGFNTNSLKKLLSNSGFTTLNIETVSMGHSSYYPWFYDGLIGPKFPKNILKEYRYVLPRLFNVIGPTFGKGDWLVGYFQKKS